MRSVLYLKTATSIRYYVSSKACMSDAAWLKAHKIAYTQGSFSEGAEYPITEVTKP